MSPDLVSTFHVLVRPFVRNPEFGIPSPVFLVWIPDSEFCLLRP